MQGAFHVRKSLFAQSLSHHLRSVAIDAPRPSAARNVTQSEWVRVTAEAASIPDAAQQIREFARDHGCAPSGLRCNRLNRRPTKA
jgi:hypothetical protein